MPDILNANSLINGLLADVDGVAARVAALETKAFGAVHAVEAGAIHAEGELAHGYATIAATAEADFKAIWAHKAVVLFDVVMLIGALVVGRYL